jgi:hypothetical protein
MVMAETKTLIFDFGFTAVDESELDAYQQAQEAQNQLKAASGTAAELEERLNALYNAMAPLLNNLKKDPGRDYILWPNRLEKIEEFEDHLQFIYLGKK